MRAMATNRLKLEPLEPRHARNLYEGLRDARLYTWIDEKPPQSLEWLRSRYERLQARRSPDGSEAWLNWAIWSVGESRYIGYVQATLRGRSAFVAYVLFADAQGKGFAREAVTAMIRELVANYNVAEVRASVDRRNLRSCALLAELDFERVTNLEDGASGLGKNEILFRVRVN
jgi:[ribosomal protein S5]-alanine N-acetyltransferase